MSYICIFLCAQDLILSFYASYDKALRCISPKISAVLYLSQIVFTSLDAHFIVCFLNPCLTLSFFFKNNNFMNYTKKEQQQSQCCTIQISGQEELKREIKKYTIKNKQNIPG